MRRGTFAGLTILTPGEPLSTDGSSFQSRNPAVTDQWLSQIVAHRHNAAPPIANPSVAPTVVGSSVGGHLPAATTYFAAYTFLDGLGGETTESPFVSITTQAGIGAPASAMIGVLSKSAGSLSNNTYQYAYTLTDGAGGESDLSPAVTVVRTPGGSHAEAILSGMTARMAASPGAVGWRAYRATGGAQYGLIQTGSGDGFTDNGTLPVNLGTQPPSDDTTNQTGSFTVVVPSAGMPSAASAFSLYIAPINTFYDPSLYGTYPRSMAGTAITVTGASSPLPGSPPPVSTAVRGAHLIDPDTELLDWHWKSPVAASAALDAGTQGDVRLSIADGEFFAVLASGGAHGADDWSQVGGSGGAPEHFFFSQGTASTLWTVTHNLGFKPNVQVFDVGGEEYEGDVTHVSVNQLTIAFTAAFSGEVHCS